ncbi:MAG: serine/threonine protein kinase, partial [Nostoc sp.]
ETTPTNTNLVGNLNPEQLSPPVTKTLSPPDKQPEEVRLLAFFAVLLVILGLLSIVALATRTSKFSLMPNSEQSSDHKDKIDYFPYQEGRDSQGKAA